MIKAEWTNADALNLQPTCNQLATDCISRQAAIDATWFEPSYTDPINVLTEVRDRLNALPTIELVRCRECKHRDPEDKKM